MVLRVEDFDPDSYQPHQRVPHWDIGAELGILDLERGAKISGSMFAMLRGPGATLSRALCQLALDRNGDAYEEIRPPSLVLSRTLTATGQLPKFADDAYHIERDDLWAIPTAEVPLTSIGMDEILDEADAAAAADGLLALLPPRGGLGGPRHARPAARARVRQGRAARLRHARAGARAARRDPRPGRGPDPRARAWPTGSSTSAPATSASPTTARSTSRCTRPGSTSGSRCRRCRGSATTRLAGPTSATDRPDAKRTELVHTLNGSALAVPRVWAALVETHRQPDGSVAVPEVLHPYLRGTTRLGPPAGV